MKLATHIAVGSSLAAAAALLLGCCYACAWFAAMAAAAANIAIDVFGHERRPYPRRTRLMHSPLGPLLASLPFLAALAPAPPLDALRAAASILLGSYSHLLLDAVTEGGVYRSPFSDRRWRLARLPYNHPAANTLATVLAALLLAAALATR